MAAPPDPFDHPTMQAFAAEVRSKIIPQLRSSALSCVIAAREPDVKLAVEIGLSILMDKPIIVVVPPGTQVPAKLIAVADRIVEWSGSDDDATAGARIAAAIDDIVGDRG